MWAHTWSGVDDAPAGSGVIAVDAAGNLYVTGGVQGSIDLDPGPGMDVHTGEREYSHVPYVVKLTSEGAYVWGRSFETTGVPYFSHLAIDPSDNVWFTGSFDGRLDVDPGPATVEVTARGSSDGMLIGLDAGGVFIDSLVASRGITDYLGGVAFLPPNTLTVGSTTDGGLAFSLDANLEEQVGVLELAGAFHALAAAPGDRVLLAGEIAVHGGAHAGALLRSVDVNVSESWSFAVGGGGAVAWRAASNERIFVVTGMSSPGGDFDPGPTLDIHAGASLFVSRYAF